MDLSNLDIYYERLNFLLKKLLSDNCILDDQEIIELQTMCEIFQKEECDSEACRPWKCRFSTIPEEWTRSFGYDTLCELVSAFVSNDCKLTNNDSVR